MKIDLFVIIAAEPRQQHWVGLAVARRRYVVCVELANICRVLWLSLELKLGFGMLGPAGEDGDEVRLHLLRKPVQCQFLLRQVEVEAVE